MYSPMNMICAKIVHLYNWYLCTFVYKFSGKYEEHGQEY